MTETFKDNIENIGTYVYSVSDEGEVFIEYYYDNGENMYLGKYENVDNLPNDSYVWDMDNIPEVKKFHEWIKERFDVSVELDELKNCLIDKIKNSLTIEDIEKLLVQTLSTERK